ncbi:esterase/lipase family protein [Planctomyces sp. SH-PL62]|uniref:esterase/lipase family protein n=1 Tax=Planctomyces sp. SH-PL62 TaxID=1636152 RepID=UPI0012E8899B|nr:hypothetical protein [Planctomyces sp. SH-PL62]
MAELYKFEDRRSPVPTGIVKCVGDVVFVHGLNGDAYATWAAGEGEGDTWPRWLKEDLSELDVWSLGYEVRANRWSGWSMQLSDRATNVVDRLTHYQIGARPVVFVCHSMGGLLIKQVLRNCLDSNLKAHKAIAANTRGIAFLATPHLGSGLADLVLRLPFYEPTVAVKELKKNAVQLRNLNTWYRNHCDRLRIQNSVWVESRSMFGVRIVDEISGDPGIRDVDAVPLDNQHVDITKPPGRWAQQYVGVENFVAKCLEIQAPPAAFPPLPTSTPSPKPRLGRLKLIVGFCLALTLAVVAWAALTGDPCRQPPDPAMIEESIRKNFALLEGVPPNSMEDGSVGESRLVRAVFVSLPLSHGDLTPVERVIRYMESQGEFSKNGTKDVHLESVIKRLPEIRQARLNWLRDEVLPSLHESQSDTFELPSMAYIDPSRGRTKVVITRKDAQSQIRCLEKASLDTNTFQGND